MFIVAQRVGGTVHKRTNVSFTNTKLLGVSEKVVWIFLDFCYCSILLKTDHVSMYAGVRGMVKYIKIQEYGLTEIQSIDIITQSCMFKIDAVRYTKT